MCIRDSCKAVEERLGIPVITGMYIENPGVDMFRKDLIIVDTPNSAAGMPKVLPVMSALFKKMAAGEEILGPKEEGYIEREMCIRDRSWPTASYARYGCIRSWRWFMPA